MLECLNDMSILESFSINDEPMELVDGRLIELATDGDKHYTVTQHLVADLNRNIFGAPYRIGHDNERIRPVLEWWQETSATLPDAKSRNNNALNTKPR